MLLELSILPIEIQQQLINKQHIELKLVDDKVVATPILAHLPFNEDDFTLDIERIQQSIDSGVVDVPKFNNHEEFLKWLNR